MKNTFLLNIKILLFSSILIIGNSCFRNAAGQSVTWTVMVYLDADNNLEEAGIDDFNEMEIVGSTASVNIIVQFDRVDGYTNSNGDWTDTRRFEVLQDDDPAIISSPAVENMGELNMGDPQVLTDFVTWSATEYPAEHYALVLWNHGGGWLKSDQSEQKKPLADKDVCYDDTNGDYLSNAEVSSAIDESGIHLDLVAYDACLMGMIEVAYQIRYLADVMVASEELVPGDGFDYTGFLSALIADPDMSAEIFATEIVNTYGDFYGDWVTLSAIDLTRITNVAEQLDSLTTEIIDNGTVWDTVGLAWLENQRFADYSYLDLGDFAQRLSELIQNESIRQKSADLFDSIQSAVIANYVSAGIPDATGISIYFPSADYYWPEYEAEGSDRDFVDSTQWVDFLHAFQVEYFPDYSEPNNHFANATIFDPYAYTTGRFTSQSDIDIFRVFYPADNSGDEYIELNPPVDVDMYLYTVIDTVIEKIDSSTNAGVVPERIYFNGLDTGYYYIVLKPLEASDELYELYSYGSFYSLDQYYGTPSTLAFDDGDPSEQYFSAVADEGVGIMFRDYGLLNGLWYYITDLNAGGSGDDTPALTLQLYLYEYGIDMWEYMGMDPIVVQPEHTGWNYVDISDLGLYFYFDKIIIGFTWDGASTPALGADSLSSDNNSFQYSSGGWTPVQENILFFIRPVFSIPGQTPENCYCDGLTILTEPSGSFNDGSGGNLYGNNCYCTWLIQPEGATSITLTIETLDLEPSWDFLYIYDGSNTNDVLAVYDGYVSNVSVSSTGGSMLLEFITDYSVTYDGWEVSYTSVIPPDAIEVSNNTNDWTIYPNPGNGIIQLEGDPASLDEILVDVLNAMGEVIFNQKISSVENRILLDISDQPKGLYYIKLTDSKESVVYKYSMN